MYFIGLYTLFRVDMDSNGYKELLTFNQSKVVNGFTMDETGKTDGDPRALSYKEFISVATYLRLISIATMYIRDRRLQTCD